MAAVLSASDVNNDAIAIDDFVRVVPSSVRLMSCDDVELAGRGGGRRRDHDVISILTSSPLDMSMTDAICRCILCAATYQFCSK